MEHALTLAVPAHNRAPCAVAAAPFLRFLDTVDPHVAMDIAWHVLAQTLHRFEGRSIAGANESLHHRLGLCIGDAILGRTAGEA